MGRTLAVTIVFVVMLAFVVGALLLLVPLIERQVARLVQSLPSYVAWFHREAGPLLQQHLHLDATRKRCQGHFLASVTAVQSHAVVAKRRRSVQDRIKS